MIPILRMLICVIQLNYVCPSYVDYTIGSFQFNGTRVGNRQTVKFTCECSQRPIEGAILFQVNSNTVDVIRLKNNRCYNRHQECRTDICLCFYDGIKFQMEYWYDVLDISESNNFGVEILLKDSNANIVTVTLSRFYNGKDFEKLKIVKEINQHKCIEKTEETGNDQERCASKETLLKFLSASVCLILMVGCVLCICRYNVFVKPGPDVIIKPQIITVSHRGPVAIYCTVMSDLPVIWYRVTEDSMTPVPVDGSKCSVKDEHHPLTVNGTNLKDEGIYVWNCTAESDASIESISSSDIVVTVAKPRPDVIIKPQIITVSHSGPVAIYCPVMSDLPAKEVIWYRVKEDSKTPVAVDGSKCSGKDEHRPLTVKGTNLDDEGIYVCKCTAESDGDIVVTNVKYIVHTRDFGRYRNGLKPIYFRFLGEKDRAEKIDVDNMSSEPKPRFRTNDTDEDKLDSSSHIYDYIQGKYETYTTPIVKDECEPAESRNTASSDKPAHPKQPPPPSSPLRPQLGEKVQIRNDDDNKQMASLYGRREENEIRFVMVGRTGSGKSATGNTIMAKADHFESKLAGGSVTRECKRGECNNAGRKIVVVDTPGLFDTQIPFEQISKEIIRCVNMSTPGPHAFLLVIQIARFPDEEIETFNRLFDLFGDGMGKFAIITFTKLDDLEREQTTVDEYIAMAPQKLKDFIKRCQGRYLAIDNKASEKKKATKVTNLIQLVDDIVNKNRGQHYTNEIYKEAEAALQRKIKKVEEEKAREKEKEIDQIESKFIHQIDFIKKDNKKLTKEVSSNQMAQRQFQREKEKAQQETIRMKEEMKKIDKKRNEEIYLIMKKKEEEMENQARDLEQLERQHLQLLQSMQQQQAETNRRYQDMERQKELQLSNVTEDHNKRMEAEIQRIVDGSDEKYKHMMQALEAKDKGYEKLQEQMAQQNSKMQELMREKDRDFLKQQEENRKRIEQGKDRSNETLRMQLGEQKRSMDSTRDIILQEQKERDQIQREEYQELKRKYKRTHEQMKNE